MNLIVAAVVLVAMRWRLNLISLGEQDARSLGVDLKRERAVIIVASTLPRAHRVPFKFLFSFLSFLFFFFFF